MIMLIDVRGVFIGVFLGYSVLRHILESMANLTQLTYAVDELTFDFVYPHSMPLFPTGQFMRH